MIKKIILSSFLLIPHVTLPDHATTVTSETVYNYYYSGNYEKDIARAVQPLVTYLHKNKAKLRSQVIILDIDETALSNWPLMEATNFNYDRATKYEWQGKAINPAIQPIRLVYLVAKKQGYGIIFMTSRKPHLLKATQQNLREQGYTTWDKLIIRMPNDTYENDVHFKTAERQKLVDAGYEIVATVGDQDGDMTGEHTGMKVKIPNPFYTIN